MTQPSKQPDIQPCTHLSVEPSTILPNPIDMMVPVDAIYDESTVLYEVDRDALYEVMF